MMWIIHSVQFVYFDYFKKKKKKKGIIVLASVKISSFAVGLRTLS